MLLAVGGLYLGPLPSVLADSCSNVNVSGSSWAKGFGVDSHSNYPDEATAVDCTGGSKTDLNANPPQYGDGWQCVELAQRMFNTRGWYSGIFAGVSWAAQIYTQASSDGWTTMPQGSVTAGSIAPGDMLITHEATYGHVMLVDSVSGNTINAVDQNGADGGRTTVTVSGGNLSDGTYYQFSGAVHSPNDQLGNRTVGDYDGDGKTNYAIFRESDGTWHYYSGGDNSYQYGSTGDIPVPGYYSGASKVDDADFRPSNSTWYIRPQGGTGYSQSFGSSGDIPVPSDFDGTGKTNYAVWRPSDGSWHYYSGGDVAHSYGLSGDIPVPGHYSGAAKADYAVFRPSNATWYIQPQNGTAYTIAFGQSGDIPAPMIWDAGGKTEPGVFRPSNGTWYYWTPSGTVTHSYGLSGDVPVPGYYSGASKPDYAVFRPSNSTWYIQPQSGTAYTFSYGSSGDVPAIQVLPLPMLQYYGLHS
jgi:hypothetical protein